MATLSHYKRPFLHISSKYNLVKVSTVYPTCYKVSIPIFLKVSGQTLGVTVGKPLNIHCTSKPGKVRLFSLKSNSGQVLALISIAKAYTGRIFWLGAAVTVLFIWTRGNNKSRFCSEYTNKKSEIFEEPCDLSDQFPKLVTRGM